MHHAGNDGERPAAHRGDLLLFAIYLALYAIFMGLVAFAPGALAKPVFGGVNLAVAYGMGLILVAVLFSAIAMVTYRHAGEGGGS